MYQEEILTEIRLLRAKVDEVQKDVHATKIEIERLKVDVKLKSALVATIFSALTPLLGHLKDLFK